MYNIYMNNKSSGGGEDSSKKAYISPERIQKLDDVGFPWKPVNLKSVTWEARYEQLNKFHDEHGKSNRMFALGFPDEYVFRKNLNFLYVQFPKGHTLVPWKYKVSKTA